MTDALPGSPVEPGDKQFQRRMMKGRDKWLNSLWLRILELSANLHNF